MNLSNGLHLHTLRLLSETAHSGLRPASPRLFSQRSFEVLPANIVKDSSPEPL